MTSDEQFKVMMRWCQTFQIKSTGHGDFFGRARVNPRFLIGTTFSYSTREAAIDATYRMVCNEAYVFITAVENHNDVF